MKKLLVVSLVCVFLLGIASTVNGQERECKAPNATWLRPSDQYVWTYYELVDAPGGRIISLPEFGENMIMYAAYLHPAQDWWGNPKRQNITKLDKNESWLCPFDKNYPYDYDSYWHRLYEQDSDNLLFDQLLGQTLYIKTENEVWYLVDLFDQISEQSSVIAWNGLIRANVHWSRAESDIYPYACVDED